MMDLIETSFNIRLPLSFLGVGKVLVVKNYMMN